MKNIPLATKYLAAGLAWLLGAVPAVAADRWQEAGSGAVAILPVPKPATGISGGSFYCSEQRWAFLLRTSPDAAATPGSSEKAGIGVGGEVFEADAAISAGAIEIGVASDILLPLKEATTLTIAIGKGKGAPKAIFNLRSSKLVIEAIAPRCSQIDMSAFDAVKPSTFDAAVPAATGLLADEIKLFREFTLKEPVVATMTIDIGADRRLMFASLCGSVNYFGDSGCSLTGYAIDGLESVWRMVYETEGVHLYTDPRQANGGWPNLVTLPVVGGTEPVHWVWSGAQYEPLDQITAEEDTVEEEGDAAQ